MATVTYLISTDDGTTINASCTVVISDQGVFDFLTALAVQMPEATANQIFNAWVSSDLDRAVGVVQSYKQSLIVPPTPITFEIIPG